MSDSERPSEKLLDEHLADVEFEEWYDAFTAYEEADAKERWADLKAEDLCVDWGVDEEGYKKIDIDLQNLLIKDAPNKDIHALLRSVGGKRPYHQRTS